MNRETVAKIVGCEFVREPDEVLVSGVEAEVFGRPKHLYSIWKKMQGKRLGIERVLVVPADGNTLVAVQRTDLNERQKVRYAIADNRASDLSEWDAATLASLQEEDPDLHLDSFWTEAELDHMMEGLSQENEEDDGDTGSQGKLEVKLNFEDPSDFETFLQSLQQLSAALPKICTNEQRLQHILDQFLSGV
jgi:hypothetical protein